LRTADWIADSSIVDSEIVESRIADSEIVDSAAADRAVVGCAIQANGATPANAIETNVRILMPADYAPIGGLTTRKICNTSRRLFEKTVYR
jgi:hypothetical protein